MSDEKIRNFTQEEQDWAVHCLAYGMRPSQVADVFVDQFPDFAKECEPEKRRQIVMSRSQNYLKGTTRPTYAKIQEIRSRSDPEFRDIPMANPWIRLNALQHAYEYLPMKIEETVVETIDGPDGTVTKTKVIHKSSVPYLLSIVGAIERILKSVDSRPPPAWNPDDSQSKGSAPTGPQFDSLNKKKDDEKKGGPIVV